MKITRSFGEYFKYSLHDARGQKIEYVDDSLIFTFDYIFSYENGSEQTHKAKIVFEKCDVNVNIRMYNFDDVQCTVIPSVAYGFVTGMNLQLC